MSPTTPHRQQGRSTAVLRALASHRNTAVHLNDLAGEAGLTREQTTSAIGNLRRTTKIESPRKGWYIYRGPANGHKGGGIVVHRTKAEVVALLDDGRLVLAVEGTLYVAHELEVER